MIHLTVDIDYDPGSIDDISRGKSARSEVIFVLPRPGLTVLTMTKPFYPGGAFRLPSGGVHCRETPEEAFRREVLEETGITLEPCEEIAVILHRLHAGEKLAEITSHLIVGPESSDPPHPLDADEGIAAFRGATADGLREMADCLRDLPGRWSGWGHFRATPHEIAADWLEANTL